MRTSCARCLLGITVLCLGACHGPGSTAASGGSTPSESSADAPPPADPPINLGEGPGGEIVPGLALPPKPGQVPTPGRPGASAPDPDKVANQEQLLAAARQALEEDRPTDALAVIDVLVVLDPNDPEAIELRARTLGRLGDHDGARADRERCCKLGRSSCCR